MHQSTCTNWTDKRRVHSKNTICVVKLRKDAPFCWLDIGCGTGRMADEDRVSTIKKCQNALCKQGVFFYFENFRPNNKECIPLFLQRWKEYQISQGKSHEEADEHMKRFGKEYFPITIDEHMKLLSKCGFKFCEGDVLNG